MAFGKFLHYQNFRLNTEVYFPINLGDTTWTMDLGKRPFEFVANKTVKVTEGTTPEGSEWAMVNLPHHDSYWVFKDLVEIPEDIAPGVYVLSFRWDCQNSPQVWNSCANIQILP